MSATPAPEHQEPTNHLLRHRHRAPAGAGVKALTAAARSGLRPSLDPDASARRVHTPAEKRKTKLRTSLDRPRSFRDDLQLPAGTPPRRRAHCGSRARMPRDLIMSAARILDGETTAGLYRRGGLVAVPDTPGVVVLPYPPPLVHSWASRQIRSQPKFVG